MNSEVNNNMFNDLIKLAKDTLFSLKESVIGIPAPQVSVICTNKNNTYIAKNDIDGSICDQLISNDDTRIVKLLTMWKNGQVDVPSFAFRKAIVEMNAQNKDTDILLQESEGFIVKKLSQTMK